MCKTLFVPWTDEKQFKSSALDQYPLLIGVSRDTNGDYTLQRLIEGSNKKPNLQEFRASLIDFKGKFDTSEKDFEKAKVRFGLDISRLYLLFTGRSQTPNVSESISSSGCSSSIQTSSWT